MTGEAEPPVLTARRAPQHVRLLEAYDAYERVCILTNATKPSPVSALCSQIHRFLAVAMPLLRVWVHCPRASNGLLPRRSNLPSSRTPLLGPSPLRTVLKTFAIYGSSPSNALLGRTRLRNGKMEAMNLVAALWVKKNAVRSAFRATHHQGKAVVKPPSGEAGDSLVAYGAASVLLAPEKAKSGRTPK